MKAKKTHFNFKNGFVQQIWNFYEINVVAYMWIKYHRIYPPLLFFIVDVIISLYMHITKSRGGRIIGATIKPWRYNDSYYIKM